MRIEIDQSGKIENTSKHTIIAFSNHKFRSILMSAKEKREVQKVFRNIGKPRLFVYRLFAIMIFLLVREHIKEIREIIIDTEYPGNEALIKNFILHEVWKIEPDFPRQGILFQQIGKKSRAHFLAYGIAIGKKKADREVNAKEALKMIVK
jgi:hypothetical protein